jgi:hypothetical protein
MKNLWYLSSLPEPLVASVKYKSPTHWPGRDCAEQNTPVEISEIIAKMRPSIKCLLSKTPKGGNWLGDNYNNAESAKLQRRKLQLPYLQFLLCGGG